MPLHKMEMYLSQENRIHTRRFKKVPVKKKITKGLSVECLPHLHISQRVKTEYSFQKANLDSFFLAEYGAKIKTTNKEISWNIF